MKVPTRECVTHAVALAGGLGTRLSETLGNLPKALATVAGKPFLDWKFEELIRNGITDVTLLVGHGSQAIEEYLEESQTPLTVHVRNDGPQLLGTGGALLCALQFLPEKFFLTYGDTLLDLPYEDVSQARAALNVPNLMAVTSRIGLADKPNCEVVNGFVVRHSKTETSGMTAMDYGLMVFSRSSLERLASGGSGAVDLAPLLNALARNKHLGALKTNDEYWEIGTPTSMQRVTRHLTQTPGTK